MECWCCSAAECACDLAAAECATAVSFAPSRRPPTLITAAPSKDPKMPSHHHLLSPPHALHEHCVRAISHPHATCPLKQGKLHRNEHLEMLLYSWHENG